MAKPVTLSNGREWRTQTAAKEHFRAILHRYGNGATIEASEDHDDLAALLVRYDSAVADPISKIGCGIDHFERRLNAAEGRSTPGFWVIRTDGSATDFSFYTGVEGQPKPEAREFSDACRAAVASDLRQAKRNHFVRFADADGRVQCDLSDAFITLDEAHLDHAYPTFGQLVVTFRAARSWHLTIPPGTLTTGMDQQTITTFVSASDADAFREFHRRAAKLRIIAARLNLANAAGQRMPKIKRPVEL